MNQLLNKKEKYNHFYYSLLLFFILCKEYLSLSAGLIIVVKNKYIRYEIL